jgi:hypothetical protein
VDAFTGEAVAARPIRAMRAGVAFGVVDTFLVRAADDTVGHNHRFQETSRSVHAKDYPRQLSAYRLVN